MKVAYLDQSGQLGGGEIALLPWLRLTRNDSMVLLFEDGPFRPRLEQEGVPVRVVPLTGLKQLRRESGWRQVLAILPTLFKARSALRHHTRDYDALYANSMKALLVASLVRRWRQPVLWHLRDILSKDHFSMLLRLVVVAVGNCCASAIIVNSRATARAFARAGGRTKKTFVVYDGVSPENFASLSAASVEQMRNTFTAPGRLLVGVFSRLSPWKGQHIALEAISAIPEVDLLIVGDVLFGESAYAQRLRLRAAEPDLAGRVTFLGFRTDIAELMQCVDVVIHSSTLPEPFGLVIVEGMLAGKPVIATRGGGTLEIIQHLRSGMFVAPGSADELRAALVYLGNNPEEAKRLGTEAKLRARRNFHLQGMYEGIEGVLRPFGKGADGIALADSAVGVAPNGS